MSFLFLISLLPGEFISKSLKFQLPSSVFYMPDKTENINYDNKSYLLYIEFVQNELDPCGEIYHAPKIKTLIQKDSLF